MHAFILFRSISFGLFALFNVLNLALAAWNLSVVGTASSMIRGVDAYTLLFNGVSLLVVSAMSIMNFVRMGSPRLWFEMAWVALFVLLSLGSAAATTAIVPSTACGLPQAKTNMSICTSSNGIAATTWLTVLLYVGWLITMIIHGVTRSHYDHDVWRKGVKEVTVTPDNNSDARLNEKFAALPTLAHSRPETRTSEYSSSTEKEKDDISIVMPYTYRSGPIGVDAINGAPVYHPYANSNAMHNRPTEQDRVVEGLGNTGSPQTIEVPPRDRRPFALAARHYAQTTGSSAGASAHAGSNPSSDFEWINTAYKHGAQSEASPSPAVIMQVHKVPPQSSMYGEHITSAEGPKRSRSNTDPTQGGMWFPPARGAPNRSSVVLVDDRRPSEGGIGLAPQAPFRMGHSAALSTDSAFGTAGKKPKHRPPPLNLSALSNIKQAEKR